MNIPSSRLLLRLIASLTITLGFFAFSLFGNEGHSSTESSDAVMPSDALRKLIDGNARYTQGQSNAQSTYLHKRDANTKGQKPFAIIVCCSDSRVPPEVIFDQSIGDLFIVRSAGHVVDDVALGSIEYAVEHLKCTYILVLGHERCGAVSATCAGGEAPGHIRAVVNAIKPAAVIGKGMPGDIVDNAVRANIRMVVENLNKCEPILAEEVKEHKLKVQGARYDLDTGLVEMVE